MKTKRMRTLTSAIGAFSVIVAGTISGGAFSVSAADLSAAQVERLLSSPNPGYGAHYSAGRFYETKGFLGQAREQYELAVKDSKAAPEAYKRLAQVCLRSNDRAAAQKVADDAMKRFPGNYGVLLTAGFTYHNLGKLPEALSIYQKAKAVRDAAPDAYLAMSDVLVDMKKPRDALTLIEKVKAMPNPSDFAYFEEAKVLLALKREEDALKPLTHNFSTDPLNYASGRLYSALLQKQGKLEQSLEVSVCLLAAAKGSAMNDVKIIVQSQLSQLPPSVGSSVIARAEARLRDRKQKALIHFALGDVYDRMENATLAMRQYRQGLLLDDAFARGYLRLAEDLEATNQLSEAAANYERAYVLDANDQEIVGRRERLKTRMGKK